MSKATAGHNDQPTVVVHGTIAVDIQGRYPGSFERFTPGEDMTMQLAELAENFGGCAMNICYGLNRLGLDAVPVVRAGQDWRPGYQQHLDALGIRTPYIVEADVPWSSRALIFTDGDGRQITAFYPGSAWADDAPLPDAARVARDEAADYVVLAPDVPQNMLAAARSLAASDIPFLLDTGQGTPDFSAAEARELVELSPHIICNTVEWRILAGLAGVEVGCAPAHCRWLLVTEGADGCVLLRPGVADTRVPAFPVATEVDHTGCGDAFRAGLVWGIVQGWPLERAALAGAACAARNVQTAGTQHYALEPQAIRAQVDSAA